MNFKVGLATIGLFFGIVSANASTVTDNFSFADSSNAVIASGSFSYSSSAVGTIGYADLSAFSITVFNQTTYDLSFVNGLIANAATANPYLYFGYNTASHQFVPASITGYDVPFSGIMAATDGFFGFAVSPLPGQADPAGTGADGQITDYSTDIPTTGFAVSLTQVSAIPEPSTWAMLLLGFVGLSVLAYRRKDKMAFGA
jgi:hypothetical protein